MSCSLSLSKSIGSALRLSVALADSPLPISDTAGPLDATLPPTAVKSEMARLIADLDVENGTVVTEEIDAVMGSVNTGVTSKDADLGFSEPETGRD